MIHVAIIALLAACASGHQYRLEAWNTQRTVQHATPLDLWVAPNYAQSSIIRVLYEEKDSEGLTLMRKEGIGAVKVVQNSMETQSIEKLLKVTGSNDEVHVQLKQVDQEFINFHLPNPVNVRLDLFIAGNDVAVAQISLRLSQAAIFVKHWGRSQITLNTCDSVYAKSFGYNDGAQQLLAGQELQNGDCVFKVREHMVVGWKNQAEQFVPFQSSREHTLVPRRWTQAGEGQYLSTDGKRIAWSHYDPNNQILQFHPSFFHEIEFQQLGFVPTKEKPFSMRIYSREIYGAGKDEYVLKQPDEKILGKLGVMGNRLMGRTRFQEGQLEGIIAFRNQDEEDTTIPFKVLQDNFVYAMKRPLGHKSDEKLTPVRFEKSFVFGTTHISTPIQYKATEGLPYRFEVACVGKCPQLSHWQTKVGTIGGDGSITASSVSPRPASVKTKYSQNAGDFYMMYNLKEEQGVTAKEEKRVASLSIYSNPVAENKAHFELSVLNGRVLEFDTVVEEWNGRSTFLFGVALLITVLALQMTSCYYMSKSNANANARV